MNPKTCPKCEKPIKWRGQRPFICTCPDAPCPDCSQECDVCGDSPAYPEKVQTEMTVYVCRPCAEDPQEKPCDCGDCHNPDSWKCWKYDCSQEEECKKFIHVDPNMFKDFDFKIYPRPWWEKYKKRETIDHKAGTIDDVGSKPYDEMWDFINEEIIPEIRKEYEENKKVDL